MNATVIDGRAVAAGILTGTSERAARFGRATGRKPLLATVLVGDDPASHTYVRMKANRCASTGLDSRRRTLPATASTSEVVDVVRVLSGDAGVDGILVQHPMPPGVDERAVFDAITPTKDVDGVTSASFAAMALGGPGFASCTPGGILRLLDAYGVDPAGRRALVIGRSAILGRPVGMLLLGRDATVTYAHSQSRDLPGLVADADIVVAAAGRPALVEGRWITPGAVVVDAGYHDGGIGDVEYETAAARAGLITPVPGGVGPVTIAVLLDQTVDAAEAAHRDASGA